MERKQFTAHDLKLTEEGEITLAFTQLSVIDKGGDVGMPGSIPTKDVPMSAYGHTSWDGALPPGRGSIREADGWGIFTGSFFMDTTHGRDTFHTVKALADLQEWSYGYLAETRLGQFEGRDVRFLDKQDIFEVSPVLRGMGQGTHVMAIKGGGPDDSLPYAEHVAWILGQWKAFNDRTADRADLRTKEGRTLSGTTLDQLAAILDQIGASYGALKDFLAANQPPVKADERLAREIDVLVTRARRMGVAI
jgi:Caudovirus prohead serine protease